MQKNYNGLKKRELKGTVAIGIIAATLLLIHSRFSNEKIEKKEEGININNNKKLVSSDKNADLNIKDNVVIVKKIELEPPIIEVNTLKSSKLTEKKVIGIQNEKLENTQTFKGEKKLENQKKSKEIFETLNKGSKNQFKTTKIIQTKSQRNEKKPKLIKKQEEIKVLSFFNIGKEIDKRHNSNKDYSGSITKPTIPTHPGIDEVKPILPEKPILAVALPPVGIFPDRPHPIEPITPEVPVAVIPLPPIGVLPDRPYPIMPITPEVPVAAIPLPPEGILPDRPHPILPITPEVPVAAIPLPPEGILPDRPYPIMPITPEVPVAAIPLPPVGILPDRPYPIMPITPEVPVAAIPLPPVGILPDRPYPIMPITPEVPVAAIPLPPVGILPDRPYPILPITPEVPIPIIIWENGQEIAGIEYILLNNLFITGEYGLRTTGGTIINKATINGANKTAMKIENHADGREGFGINQGTLTDLTNGIEVFGEGAVGINYGNIDAAKYGMSVERGTVVNNGDIKSSLSAMKVQNSGIAVNEVNGEILSESFGMYSINEGSTSINKGRIQSKTGMFIKDNALGINEGIISNTYEDGFGMTVEGLGYGENNALITGIGTGMKVVDEGSIGLNNGLISNDGSYGVLIKNKGVAINKGEISNSGNYGMSVKNEGTLGLNDVDGVISNGGSYGAGILNGGNMVNRGVISNEGHTGMLIQGPNSIGTNEIGGDIFNSGERGMSIIQEGIGINKGTVSNIGEIGMEVKDEGSTGINDIRSTISNFGNKGMEIMNKGTGINKGLITNSGEKGIYIENEGSVGINEISGLITNDGKYGMYAADGAMGINYGTISNRGEKGVGMYATGANSTITNFGEIANESKYGMYIINKGTGVNEGSIFNTGDYGMVVSGIGSIGINEQQATISNGGKHGMHIIEGGAGTNYGIISNDSYHGMSIGNFDSLGINSDGGIISNSGESGMYVTGGTAINRGIISNNDNYRMTADTHLGDGSTAVAINESILDTGFDGYTAMRGIGTDATIINKGIINVDHNNSIGMSVHDGGLAINDEAGVINLNANDGIGILVDGAESTYVNKGEINIARGTTGNRKIVLTDRATFSNSGSIVAEGEFNTDKMGDGQFIMSDGGTLEAETIKGDIYASGALALGDYEDEYSTYKMLKTDNLEGEIISNSAMFDAAFTENIDENGFYDVILERKNFHDIMNNQELAEILEDNYTEGGSNLKENYYDSLKLTSTEKKLEENVKSSYGMDTYSTITKQTFDIIGNTRKVLSKNILKDSTKLDTGEFRVIAGGDYLEKNNDGYSTVSGYETSMFSVYFGGEKQIKEKIKLGGILTVGNGDTSYDNGSSRNDDFFQGTSYLKYENENNITFTSMMFTGTTKADIKRSLQFGLIADKMESEVRSNYLGAANTLAKRFYTDDKKSYLESKLELNMTLLNQEDINESGDYALKINGGRNYSIEPGIGITVGHRVDLENGSKITLEGSAAGYAELGNPYEDRKSELDIISNEKIKIEKYEGNNYYGRISLDLNYTTKKDLTFKTGAAFNLGENQDNLEYSAGMTYKF